MTIPRSKKSEEHRPREQPDTRCETLKRIGYARNNHVRLYGEVFDLVSDPIRVRDGIVFVDALEQKSGQLRRVTIPRPIVQMAKKDRRAA
jgi:hypothetical protein